MNIIITSENSKTKSFNLNKFSISLFTISIFIIILLISLVISYAFLKYSVSNQTPFLKKSLNLVIKQEVQDSRKLVDLNLKIMRENLSAFENRIITDGWLLGDSGFGLAPYLLTPILHPRDASERAYNASHTTTRSVIERAFGVCKLRFRCLHGTGGVLTYNPGKCCRIVLACMILHNICVSNNVPLDDDDDDDDVNENEQGNEHNIQEENDQYRFIVDDALQMDGWTVRNALINARFRR